MNLYNNIMHVAPCYVCSTTYLCNKLTIKCANTAKLPRLVIAWKYNSTRGGCNEEGEKERE